MSTKIYLNGNVKITAQQAELYDEFIEVYYDNSGLPEKNLHYKNGNLESVEYFLIDVENPNDILQQYEGVEKLVLYKNAVISGVYRKYDVEYYDSNLNLTVKSIEVYKGWNIEENYPIYTKNINPLNDEVISFQKIFYDVENNITYIFKYEITTGDFLNLSVEDHIYSIDTDLTDFGSNDIGIGKNPYNFDWEGFEYYQYAEPIIPN